MQVQSQAQAQVQAQAQAQVQVQAQARILLHPNSGEGPMGDLDTVRVGRYKAKFRTGGIATECPTAREGPRKAPLLYHDPPLLFDLASDPAERNNLAPSHPYYAAGAPCSSLSLTLTTDPNPDPNPNPNPNPHYAAVLRVLLEARAAAITSVQSDELLSRVHGHGHGHGHGTWTWTWRVHGVCMACAWHMGMVSSGALSWYDLLPIYPRRWTGRRTMPCVRAATPRRSGA